MMEITDMSSFKTRMRHSACIAIAASAWMATGATAAPGDVYSGGASIIAPYVRQQMDCYGLPTQLITKGTPPTFQSESPFNYLGDGGSLKDPQNCATKHINTTDTVYYVSATSGTGILAQFSHNPDLYGTISATTTQYLPSIQFAFSETPLASADVGIYNGGGTETQGSSNVVVVAPGVTPGAGQYGNPLQLYGPLVQFPVAVNPVVIAYNAVYEKVYNPSTPGTPTTYSFNIKYSRSSGGLRLNAETYCKILNGQITNWNDPALKALNGNKSLEDPTDPTPAASWSVPLQIVGRGDSSGATSVLSRNLSAVCPALITGNNYPTGASTLPTALKGVSYNSTSANYPSVAGETPGKFTLATLNSGVTQYVAFTAVPNGSNGNYDSSGATKANAITLGRIGYVGVDSVLPAVLVTNANTYNLNSATLQNSLGQWVAPTEIGALDAFSVIKPPQSTSTGAYDASNTANGLRTNPQDWVQGLAPTSALANPTTTGSYPITGTVNFVGYNCYASKTQEATVQKYLVYITAADINVDPKNGILASAGIAPLPTYWNTALKGTFLSNTSGLGLNIEYKGAAGACSVAGIVGG
jgi:ABC-type phosphate transport system substrate-binding protein